MKRSVLTFIFILTLLFSLSGSLMPVQAGVAFSSTDLDQDGITNEMELSGWYNQAGGPYKTNPSDADSDGDGLTDAEEKLFNTNPLDYKNPGISVKYESYFKTFEYYRAGDPAYLSMVQGGDRYLLTEGLVVRRGTTFSISALNSSTASLSMSGSGMTAITPVRDPARGGWKVTLPSGGTAGMYTATVTDGSWTKSLPIYVIFQLPTDLTQAQLDAYVYDDDPANKRDEVAVWWRAVDWKYYNADSEVKTPCLPSDPVCSDWQYHTVSAFAQAFWTEQFTKNVLINFTIPVIAGTNNTLDAAREIGIRADKAVRVNFASVKNSFSSATKFYISQDPAHQAAPYRMDGGACETQAGVFTSMLRSAGIASRPFVMDYNKTAGHDEGGNFGVFEYDHAVMMWINSVWYGERTFNSDEPEYVSSPTWTNGALSGPHLFKDFRGFFKFQDFYADTIHSANEGWDFQVGSNTGVGMVNTEWTGIDVPAAEFQWFNREMKWNSKKPLEIQQSPFEDIFNCQLWMGDGWAPGEWRDPPVSLPEGRDALHTYYLPLGIPNSLDPLENWPYNPKPASCSPSTSAGACDAFKLTWQPTCAALPGQVFASPQSAQSQSPQMVNADLNSSIQLGGINGDAAQDLNGDGRFDQLVVKFDLTSTVAGEYRLGGWLKVGEERIPAEVTVVSLVPGAQSVALSFNGQVIGDSQANGPYQVEALWVAPAGQAVSELALPEEMAAYKAYTYDSQAYRAGEFTVREATVGAPFTYAPADKNGNGLVDSITISVPLNIAIPGTFTLEGDLYDRQGEFAGHAVWTGSGSVASLEYPVAQHQPPYSLEHLNLLGQDGKLLDARYAPAFKVDSLSGVVDQGTITLENSAPDAPLQSVALANSFTVTPVDLNGNNRYEQLTVSASVNVTDQGGTYWIEGLLVDQRGLPVAWGVGSPQALAVGPNQTLQMTFDGRQLFDQLPLTTGQKFTLIAVKVFSGVPGQAVLEASAPVTGFSTPVYQRSQLEPTRLSVLFEDDLESGEAKWSKSGAWSLVTSAWNSGSHAYSATNKGTLTLANSLNFSQASGVELRFRYAADLVDTDRVELQISTNGTTWTTLKSYADRTDYWTTEVLDLSAYKGQATVKIRFNVPNNSAMLWDLDDVVVVVKPFASYLPMIAR